MPDAPDQLPVTPAAAPEPVIHTIPDEFYGVAGRAKLSPVAPAIPVPAGGQSSPGAAGATPPGQTIQQPPKGGKGWIIIPIIAVLLLGGLGFAAWTLLKKPAPAAPPASKPTVTLPPIETTPEPTPEPEPEPEADATTTPEVPPAPPAESATTTEPAPAPEPPKPAPAGDADADGLSDQEEAFYGTDAAKTDSDDDGFNDYVEMVNLYNPAGFKPTRLLDAGLVTRFISSVGKFEVLHPAKWTKVDQPEGEVRFDNAENQPIAVSIEDNADNQPILDWFLSRNPQVTPLSVKPFATKQGYDAVRSDDGFTVFVAAGGKIFIIAYAPGLQENAYFKATLAMMVNSLTVRP